MDCSFSINFRVLIGFILSGIILGSINPLSDDLIYHIQIMWEILNPKESKFYYNKISLFLHSYVWFFLLFFYLPCMPKSVLIVLYEDCILKIVRVGRGDIFLVADTRSSGWCKARMGDRGHNRQLVAPQLWASTVPVRASAHHEAERAQATFPCPVGWKG